MIRVATLGAGYFAALHHDAWRRIPGVEFMGVADRDEAKAGAAVRGNERAMKDPASFGPLDVLDICLPPEAHAGAIRAAFGQARLVVCQKPFCRNLAEARIVVEEAGAAGQTLAVHENFRFQPWWRTVRDCLAGGQVGDVMDVSFRLRPGDGQGPDAYLDRQPYFRTMERFLLRETGVHFIDVFRWLLGEPVAVTARLRRLNPAIAGEDALHLLMEHEGGAGSLLDANRHLDHAAPDRRQAMGEGLVEGAEASLRVHGDGAVTLRAHGTNEERSILTPQPAGAPFGGDCVRRFQEHVVGFLHGRNRLETPADDYLRVREIEEAAYRSHDEERRIVLEPRAGSRVGAP